MSADGQTVVLADGRCIGYGSAGPSDGRPALYMHGCPGSRLDIRMPGVPGLLEQRGLRVIVPERPGYGRSDRHARRRVVDWADDVRQLVDALGIDRFVVYGYSAGGPHALACAARLPDRVASVATVSGSGIPGAPGYFDGIGPNERALHRLVRASPRLLSVVFAFARRNAQHRPESFFRDFEKDCSPSDLALLEDRAVREVLRETFLEGTRRGYGGVVDDWSALERRPWGFAPEEVRVPALIVFGDADRIVPAGQGRDLARRVPGSRVIEVPGEGHLLILAKLAEILDGLEARSGTVPGSF